MIPKSICLIVAVGKTPIEGGMVSKAVVENGGKKTSRHKGDGCGE